MEVKMKLLAVICCAVLFIEVVTCEELVNSSVVNDRSFILPVYMNTENTTDEHMTELAYVSVIFGNSVMRLSGSEVPEPYLDISPGKVTWTGRPQELPSNFTCTLRNTRQYRRPEWIIIRGQAYGSLLRLQQSLCTSKVRLELKREAWKLQEIHIALACRAAPAETKYIYFYLMPSLSVPCNTTYDCKSRFSRYSFCNKKQCTCEKGYSYDGQRCRWTSGSSSNTSGIYKATLVAIAAFTITVIALFILFMCNRGRFFRRRQSEGPLDDDQSETSSQAGDVFSVSDRLARMRLGDKPPTYQEVVNNDKQQRGIPPPAYSSAGEANAEPSSSNSESTLYDSARSVPHGRTQDHIDSSHLSRPNQETRAQFTLVNSNHESYDNTAYISDA